MIADPITSTLDTLVDRFAAGDDDAGNAAWLALFHEADRHHAVGAAILDEVVARVGTAPPLAAAQLALLGGALIEGDHAADVLAGALRDPLVSAMRLAARFLECMQAAADNDPPGEDDDLDDLGLVTVATAAGLAEADPDGHAALASLEIWYRPVVACWSRVDGAIARARDDVELMTLLLALEARTATSWIATLCFALRRDPFVVLIPELDEAFSLRVDGVVDMGQFSTMLGAALAEPLARLGCGAPPGDDVIATMQGEGPQELGVSWPCDFHLWPWQAYDPELHLPSVQRYQWRAPGGTGGHSLPSDFRPGALAPIGGVRVVVLTGPKGPVTFVRSLAATRMFSSVVAEVSGVRRLSGEEMESWLSIMARSL